jgi:hypothetical protein
MGYKVYGYLPAPVPYLYRYRIYSQVYWHQSSLRLTGSPGHAPLYCTSICMNLDSLEYSDFRVIELLPISRDRRHSQAIAAFDPCMPQDRPAIRRNVNRFTPVWQSTMDYAASDRNRRTSSLSRRAIKTRRDLNIFEQIKITNFIAW